jgi:ferritin-like metal-binding protein YciE
MARGGDELVNRILAEHADETRYQHERLAWRLELLGGSPSEFIDSFVADAFCLQAKAGNAADERGDKNLKNLVLAFAMENCEIALYEELATVAALVGDVDTEQLARTIQMEERQAAERIWNQIVPSSVTSFSKESTAA